MNTTARTSAKTLLVAAGAAGFIAFGSGFSWADTLGGATDGLPLNDLGGQVPAVLTEGIGSPVGELASVRPGTISAAPEVQHNSAPTGSLTDALPVEAPLALDGNSTDVGLDTLADSLTGTAPAVPQSGALDPVTGAVGGLGLLDAVGLGTGGGTLPLSHSARSPLPLEGTVTGLGTGVGQGAHEVGTGLTELDAADLGATLPMNGPVMPVNGRNTDISGGAAGIVSDLVLGEGAATLPQSAPADALPVGGLDTVTGALSQVAPADALPELPAALPLSTDVLPQAAPADALSADALGGVTDVLPVSAPTLPQAAPTDALPVGGLDGVTDVLPLAAASDSLPGLGDVTSALPATDSLGGDLVGVNGLPTVGEPTVDGAPLGALV
ncbi:hypothetical protein ACFVWN_04370 [Nocardiopsis flavescens]|uniref:hypothetical protein n=1 Tax=Nocardiopsis flavescens TaxID=758803 RepID=UPI003654B847